MQHPQKHQLHSQEDESLNRRQDHPKELPETSLLITSISVLLDSNIYWSRETFAATKNNLYPNLSALMA